VSLLREPPALGKPVVNVFWPSLYAADCPSLKGKVYPNMRWWPASAAHRSPKELKVRNPGDTNELAEVGLNPPNWPITNDADSPVVNGFAYSNTRLFPLSATHKLPEEWKVRPDGIDRELAETASLLDVLKPCRRNTMEAICPFEKPKSMHTNGEAYFIQCSSYSNTRLFPLSATYKLPEESNVIAMGADSDLAETEPPALGNPVVKPFWPITNDADSPTANGFAYSDMRLFFKSATHKLPEESNVKDIGNDREFADGGLRPAALNPVVKSLWPITMYAEVPSEYAVWCSPLRIGIAATTKTANKVAFKACKQLHLPFNRYIFYGHVRP
jgi:hypothetical protein